MDRSHEYSNINALYILVDTIVRRRITRLVLFLKQMAPNIFQLETLYLRIFENKSRIKSYFRIFYYSYSLIVVTCTIPQVDGAKYLIKDMVSIFLWMEMNENIDIKSLYIYIVTCRRDTVVPVNWHNKKKKINSERKNSSFEIHNKQVYKHVCKYTCLRSVYLPPQFHHEKSLESQNELPWNNWPSIVALHHWEPVPVRHGPG